MNTLIILSVACLGLALASPVEEALVNFSEDTLGNYKLNYDTKTSSRSEERSQDGKVVGSFAFFDDEGVKHTLTYVAAKDQGFSASSADLPVAVPESQELLKSRSEHLAAVNKERALFPNGAPEEKPVPVGQVLAQLTVPEIASLPGAAVPAEDAELVAAKAQLLAAYAKDLARLAEEYKRV